MDVCLPGCWTGTLLARQLYQGCWGSWRFSESCDLRKSLCSRLPWKIPFGKWNSFSNVLKHWNASKIFLEDADFCFDNMTIFSNDVLVLGIISASLMKSLEAATYMWNDVYGLQLWSHEKHLGLRFGTYSARGQARMAPSKTRPTKGWIQQREKWYDSVDWIRIAMKCSILLDCGPVLLLDKLIADFRGFIDIYDIYWPVASICSGWWILDQGCIQWVRGDHCVILRATCFVY